MRKSSQKLLTVCVVAICLALPLSFVTGRINGLVFGGMFGGRILDQETNQPVSGAYVIATWADYSFNRTTCVHMDIDITDKQGHYFFSPWVDTVGRIVVSQESSMVVVYAPGYEQVTYVGSLYVRKHHETPKERIKELRRIEAQFCGRHSSHSEQLVHRMYRDMYYEARTVAASNYS